MTRKYSEIESRNLESVRKMFTPPPDFDLVSLFVDDAVWWNGLPRMVGQEGKCEHKGIAAIADLLSGSRKDLKHLGVDAYDLSTVRYGDLLEVVEGDYIVRQHVMYAKTKSGRDYSNVYCFVFRFNADGKIAYVTEHWNTWWSDRFLFNQFAPEPTHITTI